MNYLLDTHIILWAAEDSPYLSKAAKVAVSDKSSEQFVSIISAWEVALKLGAGKLQLTGGLRKFYTIVDDYGFSVVPVEREHIERLLSLPQYHKDPFDRLLVATAITDNMVLVTADRNMHKYPVACLW